MKPVPLEDWPDRIEALVEQVGPPLKVGRVIAECDSTQEPAAALGVGSLVVTGRQVAGRGQRGNAWADTGADGLAFSLALPATTRPDRSRAVAAAIVEGLKPLVDATVKEPNDVLLEGRKLAGVLIEQSGGQAVIGIGINVLQGQWPPALAETAISLHQAGVELERIDVLERLLPGIVRAWDG